MKGFAVVGHMGLSEQRHVLREAWVQTSYPQYGNKESKKDVLYVLGADGEAELWRSFLYVEELG